MTSLNYFLDSLPVSVYNSLRVARRLRRMAAGVPRLFPLSRFRVQDFSMAPALLPGDGLLVAPRVEPRPGAIVVLKDPREPGRFLVKRLDRIYEDGTYEVLGDNRTVSSDSRAFGAIAPELLLGVAVLRYFPTERWTRFRTDSEH